MYVHARLSLLQLADTDFDTKASGSVKLRLELPKRCGFARQ